MVVDQRAAFDRDLIFHALADATRRDILTIALDGTLSVSELARRYPISLPAVQKHVAVLERAGLVTKHRQGREQLVRTEIAAVHNARELLDQLEAIWRERIGRIEAILATDPEGATQ
jgi:DNA-binding transcriptional ArsR family regulator